jgi:hypothetical protein
VCRSDQQQTWEANADLSPKDSYPAFAKQFFFWDFIPSGKEVVPPRRDNMTSYIASALFVPIY